MFCPNCDSRMSIDFDTGILHCFNCDYKEKFELSGDSRVSSEVNLKAVEDRLEDRPNEAKPDKRLLNAIDKAAKKPELTKKAKSILKLASSRGGASKVTKEDEDFIKNTVPGAKNTEINWS